VAEDVAVVNDSAARVERVYRKESAKLWRSLAAYTGSPDVASDALADAFVQLLARGDHVRDASAWVWRTAFKVAGGELKRRSHGASTGTHPDGVYQMPEPLVDLLTAMRRLSPKQRLAVVLHDYGDLPSDEVARIMGVRRATLHVHLSQGRARLRQLLEDQDG
jgi:RNA polymerase sigma-70 factor (ECF subfamily)